MVHDFCGGCAVPCLLSLALGWVSFWPTVCTAPVRCEVCGLGCPSWLVLLFMSLLSFTCSCGGMVRSQVCGPSRCSCVGLLWGSLLRRSVALAYGRTLSFSCFSLGFLLWRLFGLGLVGCGPAWVPAFFWGGGGGGGNSPSLVLVVFTWRLLLCGCPGSFLNSFLGFFPLASSFC